MTRAVIQRIGEKAYLELVEKSMVLHKPTAEDLLYVIYGYRTKLEALK
jgi:hypothetical protein